MSFFTGMSTSETRQTAVRNNFAGGVSLVNSFTTTFVPWYIGRVLS